MPVLETPLPDALQNLGRFQRLKLAEPLPMQVHVTRALTGPLTTEDRMRPCIRLHHRPLSSSSIVNNTLIDLRQKEKTSRGSKPMPLLGGSDMKASSHLHCVDDATFPHRSCVVRKVIVRDDEKDILGPKPENPKSALDPDICKALTSIALVLSTSPCFGKCAP